MKPVTAVLLLTTAALLHGAEPTLTIDAAKPAGHVSPRLYGLMTEEINYSYDGGLYAELVRNRAFLDNATTPVHWSVVGSEGSVQIAVDRKQPLNDAIPVSLRVEATKASSTERAGFANSGYWGIPVRPNTTYRASFFAKAASPYDGGVRVSIESGDGSTDYASGTVAGISADWKRYELTLRTGEVSPTVKARLAVTLDQPGTLWFSFVSLFPPTWNNRPNGLRKDLMQMLVDLHPKFLRFPGGNYVEGDNIANRFDWKKTVGHIYERPGHMSPWGYRSTDGMGLLEFLEWCEDMGAEPVLAVYAGYSFHQQVKAGPALEPFVQDALDEIEYVAGDADTKWGAQRARDGHPAAFPLHFVEIGNEDNFDKSNTYDARFTQFYRAIKEKYPELNCISTVPTWEKPSRNLVVSVRPDVVDEHYYAPVKKFLAMSTTQYEKYSRSGPKIFVGEWAAYETPFPPWNKQSRGEPPTANLRSAIGDAAFMTDFERNSDLVIMHCYAPMFVNVNPGGRQWRPDLIGYDALRSFGSPSYYAIRMFSTHVGDEILKVTRQDTPVIASATRASATGEIFLKLVNPAASAEHVKIDLPGVSRLGSDATIVSMSASSNGATNTIDNPTAVAPVTSTLSDLRNGFDYAVPANGIVVLILKSE